MTVNEFRCIDCNKLLGKYDFSGDNLELAINCPRCKQVRTLVLPHPMTGSLVRPSLK